MYYVICKYPFLKDQTYYGRVESIHKTREAANKNAWALIQRVKKAHRHAYLDLEISKILDKKKKNDLVSKKDLIQEQWEPFSDSFVEL
jgi:hypothetical protein